jgi:hypothetical protein
MRSLSLRLFSLWLVIAVPLAQSVPIQPAAQGPMRMGSMVIGPGTGREASIALTAQTQPAAASVQLQPSSPVETDSDGTMGLPAQQVLTRLPVGPEMPRADPPPQVLAVGPPGDSLPVEASAGKAGGRREGQARGAHANLPLYFIENRGQIDERVAYYAQQGGANLYFSAEEMVMALPDSVLRLRFVDADAGVRITGPGEQEARFSYFVGNDPEQWRRGVPSYGEVVYHNLYPAWT